MNRPINTTPITYTNNFDNKEVNKFDMLAAEWWNTSNVFQSLHHINTIRLHYIIQHSNGLSGKKILDVGCGGGILTESMAQQGAQVTGLDISYNSLHVAKSHALNKNLKINYIQETIEAHSIKYTQYYDVITCMEVLEHVPDPVSIIQSCATTVTAQGSVFFSTLNRTFKAWLFAIIGAEYFLHIIPKGNHNFNKFITPSELLDWIDSTVLEEKNITGLYYNPFNKKTALTHNVDINYFMHTQRTQ